MAQPAEQLPRRATYADLEAAPPHLVAELVGGVLHTFPRPAIRHARTSTRLGGKLNGPFDLGDGGPGGWHILFEPEIHFPDPTAPDAIEAVAPDLAGWRRERVPELPDGAYTTIVPDWLCEVLSPSTTRFDREHKMPLYAREGVQHAWLIDPIARTLEMFALTGGRWKSLGLHRDAARVRAAPFDAIELDLAVLWAPGVPPGAGR